ncbi:hypothetical protein [Chromobacterium vaccinii]|uniref:hypothetical protein n=1 Tax=Chromobacterium vaccinii TaxID=1108595 RepID=UPI001184BCA4|nr:hypothetical protein [Chromobacterium vaccinii]
MARIEWRLAFNQDKWMAASRSTDAAAARPSRIHDIGFVFGLHVSYVIPSWLAGRKALAVFFTEAFRARGGRVWDGPGCAWFLLANEMQSMQPYNFIFHDGGYSMLPERRSGRKSGARCPFFDDEGGFHLFFNGSGGFSRCGLPVRLRIDDHSGRDVLQHIWIKFKVCHYVFLQCQDYYGVFKY